uniref:hypothetical protein n=1 Tax=Pseudolysinimonas sp. TaxID=2680009 RepID=UPI0037844FDE
MRHRAETALARSLRIAISATVALAAAVILSISPLAPADATAGPAPVGAVVSETPDPSDDGTAPAQDPSPWALP